MSAVFPVELTERPQWVQWVLAQRNGSKPTKVPVTLDGDDASSTDPSTWCAYSEVEDVFEDPDWSIGGAGFVFTADDEYHGADLDNVRDPETGEIVPEAQAIIDTYRAAGAYIEVSVSGTGVHIISRGQLPEGGRKRANAFGKGTGLEVYDKGRYFTMSGDPLGEVPAVIGDGQEALDSLLTTYLPVREVEVSEREPIDPREDGFVLRISRMHPFFRRLHDQGFEEGDDCSSLDHAYFCRIFKFTDDFEQAERIYRASKIARPKFDAARGTETYGQRTMRKAHEEARLKAAEAVASEFEVEEDEEIIAEVVQERSSWLPKSIVGLPSLPEPNRLGFVYEHTAQLWSGATESLKTWGGLCASVEIIRDGGCVVWIRFSGESSGGELYERLLALGLTDEQIDRDFLFVEPEKPIWDEFKHIRDVILERNPEQIFIDATIGALSLHGWRTNDADDIQKFIDEVVSPLRRVADTGTITLDHVVKDAESRSIYAAGSERKVSGSDVHLGFEIIPGKRFGRGLTGQAKISNHKDRPAHLSKPIVGTLTLISDLATGKVEYDVRVGETGEKQTFRPTIYMERVSLYLEENPGSSKNAIEENVEGKATYVRKAIDILVAEGFVERENSARGYRLTVTKPYREEEGGGDVFLHPSTIERLRAIEEGSK